MMNKINTDIYAYYAQRARHYDEIYSKPAQQADLAVFQERVVATLRDHRVLEVACGTGYWTAQLATCAASVLATDIHPIMLECAKAKNLPTNKVQFALADALNLQLEESFSACFAGFFWSHIKRQEQEGFLTQLRAKLGKNALLVMLDDAYVEEETMPIARTDLEGNTYHFDCLENGVRYEVLKNFPADSALRKRLSGMVNDIRIVRLKHYWMLTGKFK